MARVSIIFGMILCIVSAVAMLGNTDKHPIQFVPLMFGIMLLFCGVVALNPHRRRVAMPISAVLALIAALIGVFRSIAWFTQHGDTGTVTIPGDWQTVSISIAMAAIATVYAIVQVYVQFREYRSRTSVLSKPPPHSPRQTQPASAKNESGTHAPGPANDSVDQPNAAHDFAFSPMRPDDANSEGHLHEAPVQTIASPHDP